MTLELYSKGKYSEGAILAIAQMKAPGSTLHFGDKTITWNYGAVMTPVEARMTALKMPKIVRVDWIN